LLSDFFSGGKHEVFKIANWFHDGISYAHGGLGFRVQTGEWRILHPSAGRCVMVRGGSSNGGGSPPSLSPWFEGTSSPSSIKIALDHVPYATQYIKNSNGSRYAPSNNFCGLASALMVRGKVHQNSSPPALFDQANGVNYESVNKDMKTIETNLQNGKYGYYQKRVNVSSQGLLYSGNESDTQQFQYTADITLAVYQGKLNDGYRDNLANERGYPRNTDIQILSSNMDAISNGLSEATRVIWNSIYASREPVVVVVDSNKIGATGYYQDSNSRPTLHFIRKSGLIPRRTAGPRLPRLKCRNAYNDLVLNQTV
jgi:hypothetical protein